MVNGLDEDVDEDPDICESSVDEECMNKWMENIESEHILSYEDIVLMIGEDNLVQDIVGALSLTNLSPEQLSLNSDDSNTQVLQKYSNIYEDEKKTKYLVSPEVYTNTSVGSQIISNYIAKKVIDNAINLKIIVCAFWYETLNDFSESVVKLISRVSNIVGRSSTNIGFLINTTMKVELRSSAFEYEIRIIAKNVDVDVGEALLQSCLQGTLPVHYIEDIAYSKGEVIKTWIENSVPYNENVFRGIFKFDVYSAQEVELLFRIKKYIYQRYLSFVEKIVHLASDSFLNQEKILDTSNIVDIFVYSYVLNMCFTDIKEAIFLLNDGLTPEFLHKLKYTANRLNFTSTFTELEKLQTRFSFLEELNGDKVEDLELLQNLIHMLEEHLNDTTSWYSSLHTIFMEHERYNMNKLNLKESFESLEKRIDSENDKQDVKKSALETVKSAAFNSQWTWQCIDLRGRFGLEIRGDIVRTSDFIYSPSRCEDKIDFVEIYALNTIFIDANISFVGEKLQVTIIAPSWQVIGSKYINLNGKTGEAHKEPKAKKGYTQGIKNGKDGKAGLPGGLGGSFYGIAKTVVNPENLKISVNGGNGAAGQDGGNGADSIPRMISAGGTGGNGGLGGRGGKKGDFKLFILGSEETKSLIKIENSDGENGLDGAGGQGGLGFIKGRKLVLSPDGIAGNSTFCLQMPKEATTVQTFAQALNHYKMFLSSKINDREENDKLKEFYQLIIDHEEINSAYTLKDLLDEYTQLEYEYFRMNGKVVMAPWFEKLNSRLINYGKSEAVTPDERYVFNLVQGKSHRKVQQSVSQIINFRNYLDIELERIKNTETSFAIKVVREESVNAIDEINSNIEGIKYFISENLQKQIEDENKNLDEGISSLLTDMIMTKVTAKAKKSNLEKYREDLVSALRYKTGLSFVGVFGAILACLGPLTAIVGITINTANFIDQQFIVPPTYEEQPPAMPRLLTNLAIHGYESLEGYQKSNREKINDGIQILINAKKTAVETNKEKEVEILSKLINDLQVVIQDNIIPQVNDNKEIRIQKLKTSLHPRLIFERLANTVEEEFDKPIYKTPSFGKLGSTLKLAQGFFALAAEGCEQIGMYLSNREEVGELTNEIQNVSSTIIDLQNRENAIYDTLIPIIDRMKKTTSNFAKEIGASMTVKSLQIKEWDMLHELSEILNLLEIFAEGFESDELIKRPIDKMKEILIFMFDLQKSINELKPEPKTKVNNKNAMADYFLTETNDADLSLSFAKFLYVSDTVDLMSSYQNIIYTFKQFVFPFVGSYMPSSVYFQRNITDLHSQTSISEQFVFDLKIFFAQTFDQNSGFSNSSSKSFSSQNYAPYPFHVWENSKHKDIIARLLSGEEVILYANISEHTEFQAVKYKKIKIEFTSNDEVAKNEIQQILNNYDYKIQYTHLGMSLNRCNDLVYAVETGVHTYITEFHESSRKRRDINEEVLKDLPRDRPKYSLPESNGNDLNYAKITYSIYSPYTDWKMKLSSMRDKELAKIQPFVNEIDIMLVGEGQYSYYLSESICDDNILREYYGEPIDPLP